MRIFVECYLDALFVFFTFKIFFIKKYIYKTRTVLITSISILLPSLRSMKSVKLRASFYHFLFHQQCLFLYESTSRIQTGCKALYVPKMHWSIQFVKFSLTNLLPFTFKTGVALAKLLLIFSYRCSRCFSNNENFLGLLFL